MASSVPPPLPPPPPLPNPFFHTLTRCHPSLSLPLPFDAHTPIHVYKRSPVPPFLQTDANGWLVLLVSVGVSFEINLYTSAPEVTSIGLNSFNSRDICLLAYLLSKQAQAQLASWKMVTHAFVSIREENVIALRGIFNSSTHTGMILHIPKVTPVIHGCYIHHTFIVYCTFPNSCQELYLTRL